MWRSRTEAKQTKPRQDQGTWGLVAVLAPGPTVGTQGSEPKVTKGGGLKATGQFHLVSHERGNYFRFLNRETRDTVLIKHPMGEFQFLFRITFYQVLILQF